jgi:hypothetical protein
LLGRLLERRIDRGFWRGLRLWYADRVEVDFFAFGGLAVVGIFVVKKVRIGGLGFGRIEQRVVPDSVPGSRVVRNVVGSALEEVADGQIEGEVISLEIRQRQRGRLATRSAAHLSFCR